MAAVALPPFARAFEQSPSYADFAAPDLADVAATVDTADKRAAMDPKDLSKAFAVLSSRLVTAASRPEPEAAEAAVIASLPEELRAPAGAMAAAIDADDTNAALKVWRCPLVNEANPGDAVRAAAIAEPANATIFNFLLLSEVKKAQLSGNPLENSITIEGLGTKTLAEWFAHGISLDEFNVYMWHSLADCLHSVHDGQRRIAAQKFQVTALELMRAAKSDQEREEIQLQLMEEMKKSMPPRPKVMIDGQEFDRVMVSARVLQLRQMHIAAFGEDVVSATRFDKAPLPPHPARWHFNHACRLLISELEPEEEITIDTFKKSTEGSDSSILVASGTKTLTKISAAVEILTTDPSDAQLWGSLASSLHQAEQPSVDISGKTVSVIECAVNACERLPTEQRAWDLLMTILVRDIRANMKNPEDREELTTTMQDRTVMVRGVPLPGGAIMGLAQAPPQSEAEFVEGLALIQKHA